MNEKIGKRERRGERGEREKLISDLSAPAKSRRLRTAVALRSPPPLLAVARSIFLAHHCAARIFARGI